MRTLEFKVPEEYQGKQALHFLKRYAGLSSRIIRRLKGVPNGMLLNGEHIRTVDVLHAGDIFTINIPPESTELPKYDFFSTDVNTRDEAEDLFKEIEILFEDEDILVVSKPGILSVHQTHNHRGDTLADFVQERMHKKGGDTVFRAVGRLDKGTSGIVVCALNPFSASKLQGNIKKTYYAFPTGFFLGAGTIDAPIYRPDPVKVRRSVDERGDRAVTHWKTIKTGDDFSFLEINLETGRTHQIRVHFANLGAPLLGDRLYGNPDCRIKRQALHCGRAELTHPVTGKKMEFLAPLPDDMNNILRLL